MQRSFFSPIVPKLGTADITIRTILQKNAHKGCVTIKDCNKEGCSVCSVGRHCCSVAVLVWWYQRIAAENIDVDWRRIKPPSCVVLPGKYRNTVTVFIELVPDPVCMYSLWARGSVPTDKVPKIKVFFFCAVSCAVSSAVDIFILIGLYDLYT